MKSTSFAIASAMLFLLIGLTDALLPRPALPSSSTRYTARAARLPAPCMSQEVLEQAEKMCDGLVSMLSDDCTPPTELATLKEAIAGGDVEAIRVAQLELLIEQTLGFDITEEGKLEPTKLDISNKEDEEVMKKMAHLYAYGIKMFKMEMIAAEPLQSVVLERLAKPVGLDGKQFDEWLAVPAAM